MNSPPDFPEELLLHEPDRSRRLIREFYEQYHETARSRDAAYERKGRHDETKAAFFRKALAAHSHNGRSIGVDVGCRGGVMIKLVGLIRWIGVDIDEKALAVARAAGIPCAQMDFTSALGFRDESFDAVSMTDVLEHIPYPSIIVREVHRTLKKNPGSIYFGSVPLDYHLHRRWKVLRGKRLSGEQTHVHHFSFQELDRLLRFYFDAVDYLPLAGTSVRYPSLKLSYNLFVRDIAWAAASPKLNPGRWEVMADKGLERRDTSISLRGKTRARS
ncbi:MAG TPA: class I SAM-dependent methyltransferase [Chthoniobacterales bacterium]|nr:class I SAM-dependent methyltransferase [Chthoniobacterales bacterium]